MQTQISLSRTYPQSETRDGHRTSRQGFKTYSGLRFPTQLPCRMGWSFSERSSWNQVWEVVDWHYEPLGACRDWWARRWDCMCFLAAANLAFWWKNVLFPALLANSMFCSGTNVSRRKQKQNIFNNRFWKPHGGIAKAELATGPSLSWLPHFLTAVHQSQLRFVLIPINNYKQL